MSDSDTTVQSTGGRDRRDSTSSCVSLGGSSLNSSLLVNRSAWIPDDEEQAELDRMAAEFEEAEKFELSVEVEDPTDDSSVEPGDALDISEARFATPSSVLSSTSESKTSRLPLFPASSTRGQKRKSIAERLADDFLRENEPKRRSLHKEDEEDNDENEKPLNISVSGDKKKSFLKENKERTQVDG
ncbi:hypothetical protein PRIPAC_73710 [Pristionchus pacificus]|uniref:Uncharacterized protein n=1 Tax=Pristionchus pacificus TaxID=54126 RepID=A0A2A6BFE6_PRIPA|nr:hypothetical protein PRIPAC_73710 [Pristionchus pacificus]|eukprot:PDM64607.1 hypothetical protein PRIPAC_52863 [Pristionchus pacificus]